MAQTPSGILYGSLSLGHLGHGNQRTPKSFQKLNGVPLGVQEKVLFPFGRELKREDEHIWLNLMNCLQNRFHVAQRGQKQFIRIKEENIITFIYLHLSIIFVYALK